MRALLLLMLLPITLLAQQPEQPSKENPAPLTKSEAEQKAEKEQDRDPQDRDFKPSEEISEDFPVPLPSDI